MDEESILSADARRRRCFRQRVSRLIERGFAAHPKRTRRSHDAAAATRRCSSTKSQVFAGAYLLALRLHS
jgi:hypothetical protein